MFKLSKLKTNSINPRTIDTESIDRLATKIKEYPKFLSLRPIIYDDVTFEVLGGNQRLKALKQLGYKEVSMEWIKAASELTDEEKKAFIVIDNINDGKWDFEVLDANFGELDLGGFGLNEEDFGESDNSKTENEAKEDDFEVKDDIKTDIVLGDLFEFKGVDGQSHRLLCGDSTDKVTVEKLMNGDKVDMVFTDPPYLMDFQGGIHADGSKSFNAKHGSIKNDKMSKKDGDDFLDAINANIQLFCNGAFYIFFYRLKLGDYFASLERTGLQVRSLITWNKGNHTLSNSDYMSKCEHIFYGWVNEHNFYGGNNGMDIWDIPRTQKNDLHPTMKPIPLCEKAIRDGSKIKDKVLDLFLGSGSTMVAAHQLNRNCYGLELDPKYCQVIVDRMKALDNTIKILKNGLTYE
jgi:DNA modification methylase